MEAIGKKYSWKCSLCPTGSKTKIPCFLESESPSVLPINSPVSCPFGGKAKWEVIKMEIIYK